MKDLLLAEYEVSMTTNLAFVAGTALIAIAALILIIKSEK